MIKITNFSPAFLLWSPDQLRKELCGCPILQPRKVWIFQAGEISEHNNQRFWCHSLYQHPKGHYIYGEHTEKLKTLCIYNMKTSITSLENKYINNYLAVNKIIYFEQRNKSYFRWYVQGITRLSSIVKGHYQNITGITNIDFLLKKIK